MGKTSLKKYFIADVLKSTQTDNLKAAARIIGCSTTTLYSINKSEYTPVLETVEKIKAATGLNVQDYLSAEKSDLFLISSKKRMLDIAPLLKAISIAGGRAKLVKISGVPQSSISKAMTGSGRFSAESVQKIAKAVGMEVSEFDCLNSFQINKYLPKVKKEPDVFSKPDKKLVRVSYRFMPVKSGKRESRV